jgi:hypothetical protein
MCAITGDFNLVDTGNNEELGNVVIHEIKLFIWHLPQFPNAHSST